MTSLTQLSAPSPIIDSRILDVIDDLKTRLQSRYEGEYPCHETTLIQEAIEEAELLAWATPFPHLFLPDFAEIRIATLTSHAAPLRDKRCISLALAA
jgi:hypothetical protein